MSILTALVAGFSIRTLLLILIGLWIVVAVIKKLFKLGLIVLLIFALIYYIYPLIVH